MTKQRQQTKENNPEEHPSLNDKASRMGGLGCLWARLLFWVILDPLSSSGATDVLVPYLMDMPLRSICVWAGCCRNISPWFFRASTCLLNGVPVVFPGCIIAVWSVWRSSSALPVRHCSLGMSLLHVSYWASSNSGAREGHVPYRQHNNSEWSRPLRRMCDP